MSRPDPDTIAFYDREAATYARWTDGKEPPRSFRDFAALLAPGAHVLDLGCGGGWATRGFRDRGLLVTALDASAAMVAGLAGEDGIDAIHGGFLDLPPGERFDAVWASFSLQHAPREDMPAILAHVAATLKPGGLAWIGVHEGTQTLRDGLGRHYCHYRQDEMTGLLADAGCAVETVSFADDKGYDGRPIRVMTLLAWKAAA